MCVIFYGFKREFKKMYSLVSCDKENILVRNNETGLIERFERAIDSNELLNSKEAIKVNGKYYKLIGKKIERKIEKDINFSITVNSDYIVGKVLDSSNTILFELDYGRHLKPSECMTDLKERWKYLNE